MGIIPLKFDKETLSFAPRKSTQDGNQKKKSTTKKSDKIYTAEAVDVIQYPQTLLPENAGDRPGGESVNDGSREQHEADDEDDDDDGSQSDREILELLQVHTDDSVSDNDNPDDHGS